MTIKVRGGVETQTFTWQDDSTNNFVSGCGMLTLTFDPNINTQPEQYVIKNVFCADSCLINWLLYKAID